MNIVTTTTTATIGSTTIKPHRQASRETGPVTVPKVRLYVEPAEPRDAWFVNIGHVADRGRWRTEPHAHPQYGQVIFIRNGRGVMNLEGCDVPFEAPCALLLPPDCVHGLDYEIDADRWVVTIEMTYLTQVNAKLPEFAHMWASPRVISLAQDADEPAEVYSRIRGLEHEVGARSVGHVVGTEALLTSLLLVLARSIRREPADHESATRSATRLAERFRELIDQHYRDNLRLQNYAEMMAVSPAQLRAACAAAKGLSPTKMIHARIITEAKRSLIFSDMSIEQIAYGLGFLDTAYFTRFFRKEVGPSPSQFRLASRDEVRHAA